MEQLRKVTFAAVADVIMRQPLLFIAPAVIAVSSLLAYANKVHFYRSSGVVAFDTEFVPTDDYYTLMDELATRKTTLVTSILYGEPLRRIITTVWPELTPETNSAAYYNKAAHLKSASGLRIDFERNNKEVVKLSYTSTSPKEAYKVVKAAVDTLVDLNRQETEARYKGSIGFLTKELENTKAQLRDLEGRLIRVKNGLPPAVVKEHEEQFSFKLQQLSILGPGGKNVLSPVGDLESEISRSAKYATSLGELEFNLRVAEKEYERLKAALKSGEIFGGDEENGRVDTAGDELITNYSKSIASKEEQLNELFAKGYRFAHPRVKTLEAEIASLKKLRADRVNELRFSNNSQTMELARLKAEQRLRAKIQAKKEEIQSLKDRIKTTQAFEEELQRSKRGLNEKLDLISYQKSLLEELENKKLILTDSYNQLARRLEVAKRESRFPANDIGIMLNVAEPPQLPVHPVPRAHASLIIMGLLLSLAVGLGLAALISVLDTTVHSLDELQQIVDIPVIAGIDAMITAAEMRKERIKTEVLLVTLLLYVLCSKSIVGWLF